MPPPDPDKALRRLQGSTAKQLAALSTRLLSGEISARRFAIDGGRMLREAHSRAAFLGRVKAGDRAPFDVVDKAAGQRAGRAQVRFLRGFKADLTGEGGYTEAKAKARAALYSLALTGTANSAMFDSPYVGVRSVRWVLGAREEHCEDCQSEAAVGWRRPESLKKYPGEGRTACLVRCGCVIEQSDGKRGFSNG